MYVTVRLENKEGIHNKFYEMTLSGGLLSKTTIQIYSGRIGVTRVDQSRQRDIPFGGWNTWNEGYVWFTKQLKKKVGVKKEYELRNLKASADAIKEEVQRIADDFGSERKKVEAYETFLQTHWW